MTFLAGYVENGYLTLIILATLTVMMFSNRSVKIRERWMIYVTAGLTLLVSVCEYLEVWCDSYGLSYRILYYKAAAIYSLYPLILLLLLYMTGGAKHKLLLAVPELINVVLELVDISGTGMIYYYWVAHNYDGGPLRWLPLTVEIFYLLLLIIYSFRQLRVGRAAFGTCAIFMAGSVLLTIGLTSNDVLDAMMVPAVVALELLVYYFYLSAIQYRETQEELSAERLELERSKNNLLTAQIRPHFINSSLAVIRSLCFEDAERAVAMIDHFSAYLRENIRQLEDMTLVPFEKEMESVENYLYLEEQRFPGQLRLVKQFEVTEFTVPPLSVQTLVENAVRHGISMTGREGTIEIRTLARGEDILIIVKDDGKGFDVEAVSLDGVKHVGIKNVRDRFQILLGGEVTVKSSVGEGTEVTIRIPERGKR